MFANGHGRTSESSAHSNIRFGNAARGRSCSRRSTKRIREKGIFMSARAVIGSVGALLGIGAAAVGIGVVTERASLAVPGCGVLQGGASAAAQRAVAAACSQIGVRYSWGGGHGPAP